jgi:iron(III) transport system permease protein
VAQQRAIPVIYAFRQRKLDWRLLLVAVYGFVVLGPFLALVARTVQAGPAELQGDWGLLLPLGRRLNLFMNSLLFSGGTAFFSMLIGALGAIYLWGSRRWGPSRLWLLLPFAALPPYMHALTWMAASARTNDVFRTLGVAAGPMRGWMGSLWVETATYAPLALGFAFLGLLSIDPDQLDAARSVRPDLPVLKTIILPIAAPALLTGAGIIFLLSLLDYSVPSLFQVNTYSMEIFAEYSAGGSAVQSFLLALPLILIAVLVLLSLLGLLRTLTSRGRFYSAPLSNQPIWPVWFRRLIHLGVVVLLVQIILPVFTLLWLSGGPGEWVPAIAAAGEEFRYSFSLAFFSALVSIPIAWSASWVLTRLKTATLLGWLIVLAPLALPASLVGLGWLTISQNVIFNQGWVLGLLPVVTSVSRFAPLAVLILLAQSRRSDHLLFDAARLSQPSAIRRLLFISIPLHAPGLFAAAAVVFVLTLGELGGTLMVVPPGKATLTMRIYNYLHYGATETVASLCLVIAAGVLLTAGGAARSWLLWRNTQATGRTS